MKIGFGSTGRFLHYSSSYICDDTKLFLLFCMGALSVCSFSKYYRTIYLISHKSLLLNKAMILI